MISEQYTAIFKTQKLLLIDSPIPDQSTKHYQLKTTETSTMITYGFPSLPVPHSVPTLDFRGLMYVFSTLKYFFLPLL